MSESAVDSCRVSAILVVHDGATWLPETVASLASQTRAVDSIIAVDTGSHDLSPKLLKGARIPAITVDRTTGFASAVAAAVANLPAPIEGMQEWLWIIHDDCAPQPGALEALLSAVIARPNVVMAGPKLLGWHDRSHLLEVGISIAANGARWTGLEPDEYDQGQHDGVHEVLAVSTAGALIRRDVFEELGGFDKNVALFRDDVDFGWRVRVAGHSVICVSDAIAFHAQAAANERRTVDVEGAFLHRPHLLDRRNSAYVLLANASWWLLPAVTLQILSSALVRAGGYLFAKLPGYASDELLAVGSIFLKPNELIQARRDRRKKRLIPARVVRPFIPSALQQVRTNITRGIEVLRERILREKVEDAPIADHISDDEDLLTPIKPLQWRSLLLRPHVIAALSMALFTIVWSRNRFGTIAGGALAAAPQSATQLWEQYFASWHPIGMGTTSSMPVWTILIAVGSLMFLGNVHLFITVFFLAAPGFFMWSSYYLLKKLTSHITLALFLAGLYAISPVALAAVNQGRIGTIVILALAPLAIRLALQWREIEQVPWPRIYIFALLYSVMSAFSLLFWLMVVALSLYGFAFNYLEFHRSRQRNLLLERSYRRLALILIPLLTNFPYSFEAFTKPWRFFFEPGLALNGGTWQETFLGNPGGIGALPLWVVSPAVVVLFVAFFSVTHARHIAEYSIALLLLTVLLSSVALAGNGSSSPTTLWVGTPLAFVTLGAMCAAAVMLDKVRDRLVATHVNYRHISVATLALVTSLYILTSITWIFTSGANSPVQTHQTRVVPEFLGVDPTEKTLVMRQRGTGENVTLAFYIARGRDIRLGEADIAPLTDPIIDQAARELVDGSGLQSSLFLAQHGVKNIFLKNPAPREIARIIDGIGGFSRTSATNAGIVWKVSAPTGRLIFTNLAGVSSVIATENGVGIAPSAGTMTFTENFHSGWQVLQNGVNVERDINKFGVAQFKVTQAGEFILAHDGTAHRAMISLQAIFIVVAIILALPSGRRRRELSDREIS